MYELFFSTMERLTPALRSCDLAAVERGVAEQLRALPESPFHLALELSISNDPADAAAHFDHFFDVESKRIPIAAAYTEMNGFDINPDEWYCDQFAYTKNGGHEDYDWLSDWQSEYFDPFVITGLEELQAVYASGAYRVEEFTDAGTICNVLVVSKFQRFMQAAACKMMELRFPLYVTAHDYDFIAEIGAKG
jgi:hypothetical protein